MLTPVFYADFDNEAGHVDNINPVIMQSTTFWLILLSYHISMLILSSSTLTAFLHAPPTPSYVSAIGILNNACYRYHWLPWMTYRQPQHQKLKRRQLRQFELSLKARPQGRFHGNETVSINVSSAPSGTHNGKNGGGNAEYVSVLICKYLLVVAFLVTFTYGKEFLFVKV